MPRGEKAEVMENENRNRRKVLDGVVTSRMGAKSVKVTIPYKRPHPLYLKVVNRKIVVHAHDEANECGVGDKVEIMETRPLSKLKRWRVVKVTEKAPKYIEAGPGEAETSN